MVEPSLFDEALSRTDDPATSKAAAATVDVVGREAEVLGAMRYIIHACDTADIQSRLAQAGFQRDRNNIARRLTTLHRKGRVCPVGTKVGPHGRATTLWMLSEMVER